MRNVIITGQNGYIANQTKKELEAAGYSVQMLSLRTEAWKQVDFSDVDTVVHCAALVHKSEKEHSLKEYRAVNTELTAALAEKAKAEGVSQFVFFSTIAVYGTGSSCVREIRITSDLPCVPKRKYAITKYEAEQLLRKMEDPGFRVAILRPPFIYGKGCPGNYASLRNLVLKIGLIPRLNSKYSMIYIETLCGLVRQIVETGCGGLFLPQDLPVHSTWELAREIARCHNRRVICTRIFNPLIRLASLVASPLQKAFGSEYYEESLSDIALDYPRFSLAEAVQRTEME